MKNSINILLILGLISLSAPILANWKNIEFDINQNKQETAIDVKILNIPPYKDLLANRHTFSLQTRRSLLSFSGNKIRCEIHTIDAFNHQYTVTAEYNPKTKEVAIYRHPFRLGWKKVASLQLNDKTPDMMGHSFSVSKKDENGFRDVSISIPIE